MTALTSNLQTPEHLLQPDAGKTGEEFDVSARAAQVRPKPTHSKSGNRTKIP
jgi:hypothetical protein